MASETSVGVGVQGKSPRPGLRLASAFPPRCSLTLAGEGLNAAPLKRLHRFVTGDPALGGG